MIDQPTIDRILDAAQIVDVVSDFVTLRKRGVNYVGLCPFHDDKTPSFYVSPAKGLCKCFACGKGGNVVHFIMEHEQMSYPEALKYLAKKYGIEVKERELSNEEKLVQSERESLFIVNQFARDYFQNILHNHVDGRSIGMAYFRNRGFRDDIIEKFQLGYCTESHNAMAEEALKDGSAYETFLKMAEGQGGDISYLKDPAKFKKAAFSFEVRSEEDGFVSGMDAEGCGTASMLLGAGRAAKDDVIDFSAGILLKKKYGDPVKKGDVLAVLYADKEELFPEAAEKLLSSYEFSSEKPEEKKLNTKPQPQKWCTQAERQLAYDNYETTDDHGMQIYGIAKDQEGNEYYMVKNSWGTNSKYNGIWYASKAFVRYKTMNIVVHKDALPKAIKAKLGIK